MLLRLAWRNLQRHERRSALTSLAIALSVGFLFFAFTYIQGVLGHIFKEITKNSGHVRLTHPGYPKKERMVSLAYSISEVSKTLPSIRNLPQVERAYPRIKFGAIWDAHDKNQPGLGIALDAADADESFEIGQNLVAGNLFSSGQNQAVVGKTLADKLELNLGDELLLLSSTRYGSFAAANLKISGIANMGNSVENNFVFVDYQDMCPVLDMNDSATELVVYGRALYRAQFLKANVEATVQNTQSQQWFIWEETGGFGVLFQIMKAVLSLVIGTLVLVASVAVLNTMLMAVLERRREIGLLLAMGWNRSQILRLFLYESLMISLAGAALGIALGFGPAYYISTVGIHLSTDISKSMPIPFVTTLYGRLTLGGTAAAMGLGLVMGTLGVLWPAGQAARLEPVAALRKV